MKNSFSFQVTYFFQSTDIFFLRWSYYQILDFDDVQFLI